MDEYNGDFLVADEKIQQGMEWSDTMTIPIAGEKHEFGFVLLDERVRQEVQSALPLEKFKDYRKGGMSDEQERLMELQRKDELSESEQEELVELAEQVNPEEEGQDTLGKDAVNALMDAGKHAIEPTEDDIQDIMQAPPATQEQIFDEIPSHLDQETARTQLKSYMQSRVEKQPFPIKFQIGQRAFMETVAVQGNGFRNQ
jgi:hypothetical protein